MSSAANTFDEALRAGMVPALKHHGFAFDGKRTFRRCDEQGRVEIANLQLGQRSLAGKFTVNLGLFLPAGEPRIDPMKATVVDCPTARRERLGCLVSTGLPALQALPVIGFLFGPRDTWWTFTTERAETMAQLQNATSALVERGLPWFRRVGPC